MMQSTHLLSDAELIHAYLQGQEQALETLIYKHKDRIYTMISVLVKDQFLAEDLFQETFLKVIITIKEGRYAEQGKFLPWVIRVAHNLCMDHFRKIKKDIPIITEDGYEISRLMRFAAESPETTLERRQTEETVRRLIEQLPEEQRTVIVLRIYADLSFKEIAAISGVSINTALGRMRYGLINLRKIIQEKQMILR